MRATFPEYVVALATIIGSVLFTVSFLQHHDLHYHHLGYSYGL
jgi:hypothetical protein